jgi:hypothetical protein
MDLKGGGATDDYFRLEDIGDYTHVEEIFPIGVATLFVINIVITLARMGVAGGKSLNAYFDNFGLEGILTNTSLVVLLFQLARFGYSSFYTSGGRPWSPLVFVCVLVVVQMLHDLMFYYGVVNQLSFGKNEMVDVLKKYSAENGSRALAGHAAFMIGVAICAMLFKDKSLLFLVTMGVASLYILPLALATMGPKPPPPPPPPEKKAGDMRGWNGPRY